MSCRSRVLVINQSVDCTLCNRLVPLGPLPGFIADIPTLLIFGHLVQRGAGKLEDLLMGLLLGLAKLVINRSKQRAMDGVIMADCLPRFHGYVRARAPLEKEHAVSTNTLAVFQE
eukprot:g33464.t1